MKEPEAQGMGAPGGGPDRTDDAEAARIRTEGARNRTALAWILAGCAVLAVLGFLFALWLREQPKIG